jgi:2-oxo-4-hydroxy-4-carboxy--5-ureidoimidazoline (OHCU) decarboxylase
MGAKEAMYQERKMLTHLLVEELERLDYDRLPHFKRRLDHLHLQPQALLEDTISNMRKKADVERKLEREQLIKSHPWFNELVDKVITAGKMGNISETEELIIACIRG